MNDPKIVFGRDCARLLRQLQLPAESQDVFKTSVEKKKVIHVQSRALVGFPCPTQSPY